MKTTDNKQDNTKYTEEEFDALYGPGSYQKSLKVLDQIRSLPYEKLKTLTIEQLDLLTRGVIRK